MKRFFIFTFRAMFSGILFNRKRLSKYMIILTTLSINISLYAQSPQKMSYQSVLRNTTGQLLVNKTVGIKISILQGSSTGTVIYAETQTATTNAFGLISLQVGAGTVTSGTSISTINWGNGPYFIKTETDPDGGSAYSITGSTEMLSVPYALYAQSSGGVSTISGGSTGLTPSTATSGAVTLGGKLEVSNGGTGISSAATPGGIVYGSTSTALGYSSAGTSGQVLISGGTGAPLWANASTISIAGDVSGTLGSSSVDKLKGSTLSFSSLANGNLLQYNGSQWVNITPASLGTVSSVAAPITATDTKGITLSSNVLSLEYADATHPGIVSTGAQSLAGSKSFSATSDPVLLSGGVGTQSATSGYSDLVIDNSTGAIRKAPIVITLGSVKDNTLTTPPSTPSTNDAYIVPSGGTGAWASKTNSIATYNGSSWSFYSPSTNDRTTVTTGTNAGNIYTYDGTNWVTSAISPTTNWSLSGNSNSSGTRFLGTTDATALTMKTNNTSRMSITATGSVGIGTTSPGSLLEVSGDVKAKRYLSSTPASISSASTTTIDLSTGNLFTLSIGASISTLNLTNATTSPETIILKLTYSSSTAYTVTWPSTFKWSGGTAPVLTCATGKTDIISMFFDGTNYYCSYGLNF